MEGMAHSPWLWPSCSSQGDEPTGLSMAPFSPRQSRQQRRALVEQAGLVGLRQEGRAALGTGRACWDGLGTRMQPQLPPPAQLCGAGAGPILP